MEGLDWSKFQQHEIEESLIIPNLYSRDNNFNHKIDPFPNLFPQWNNANHGTNSPIFQYNSNHPQIGPILNCGPTSPQRRNVLCGQVPADSLESIDCLLSASNLTDTTTSIEDDGISLIFSNCNNLWSNNNNSNNNFAAVKSVQSLASLSENTGPGMDTNNCGSAPQTSSHEIEKIPIIINNHNNNNNNGSTSATTSSQCKRKRGGESQQNHLDFQKPISQKKPKRPMLEKQPNIAAASSNINFQQPSSSASSSADEPDPEAIAHMKEIIYRAAAFRPVDFGTEAVEKPKRKNVRISSDPQTVAARQRREKISERIRVLQRLVPGGSKMDTASMLDEAANYLKFLRAQIKALEGLDPTVNNFPAPFLMNYSFAMQQQQPPQFSIQSPNPVNQPRS